jgi:hypothetical protein
MVVGMDVGFVRRLRVSLHLGADVGRFFSVVSSGLFSGLEHGGHQMLGLNSRVILSPKHGANTKMG